MKLSTLIYFCLIPVLLTAAAPSAQQSERFIRALISNSDELISFIDHSDLKTARRLGIRYRNTSRKFLISYDIPSRIKEKILSGEIAYSTSETKLEDGFSRLTLKIKKYNYKQDYFFKRGKLVSPFRYYCRNWQQTESFYFRFHISEPQQFNAYCRQNLDNFVNRMAGLLNLSEEQRSTLRAQKIDYYLCKDEQEIEKLTGFNIRGMYNLAHDCIVTTFNAHYHELMHLLINFKLQNLPLYTHPFFQEGFAVAFGGRGGKEPRVILDSGLFLYKSGMLNYSDLLTKNGFERYDASLSYPASGLYNLFLVRRMGIEAYLKLYTKYSGTADFVSTVKIHRAGLPSNAEWMTFLDNFERDKAVTLKPLPGNAQPVFRSETAAVYEDSACYYFQIEDTLLIKTDERFAHYASKIFNRLCKNQTYKGEKYLIITSSQEVSIYNLFTNNLAAGFVSSFTIPPTEVPIRNHRFQFCVRKNVFEKSLAEKNTNYYNY